MVLGGCTTISINPYLSAFSIHLPPHAFSMSTDDYIRWGSLHEDEDSYIRAYQLTIWPRTCSLLCVPRVNGWISAILLFQKKRRLPILIVNNLTRRYRSEFPVKTSCTTFSWSKNRFIWHQSKTIEGFKNVFECYTNICMLLTLPKRGLQSSMRDTVF